MERSYAEAYVLFIQAVQLRRSYAISNGKPSLTFNLSSPKQQEKPRDMSLVDVRAITGKN